MSAAELQTPILDGGIRSVNFFNGRLLTARDLSREQEANVHGRIFQPRLRSPQLPEREEADERSLVTQTAA